MAFEVLLSFICIFVAVAHRVSAGECQKFDELKALLNAESDYYNYRDEIAQATCTAMNTAGGWTYAVRRKCSSAHKDCNQVCTDPSLKAQDGQVSGRNMVCFNSLHVYDRPGLSPNHDEGAFKLGLKVYRYNGCGGGCGPNYCCCAAR